MTPPLHSALPGDPCHQVLQLQTQGGWVGLASLRLLNFLLGKDGRVCYNSAPGIGDQRIPAPGSGAQGAGVFEDRGWLDSDILADLPGTVSAFPELRGCV